MMGWSCGRRKDTIEGRDEEERRLFEEHYLRCKFRDKRRRNRITSVTCEAKKGLLLSLRR